MFVKSVRIWSFPGPYFPVFGLNTVQQNSEYGHFSLSGMFLLWYLYLQFYPPDLDLPFFNPSFISLFPSNSSNFLLFSWFDYFVSIICKIICAILEQYSIRFSSDNWFDIIYSIVGITTWILVDNFVVVFIRQILRLNIESLCV